MALPLRVGPWRRPGLWLAGSLLVLALAGAGAWWWGATSANGHRQSEPTRCDLAAEPPGVRYPGMVWVPGGTLTLGDLVYPEEQPMRKVAVAGFWIDRTEVTNAEFAEFVRATGHVTVAERPVDAQRHPGLPAELRAPGAVVFTMPNAVGGRGDLTQWWRYVAGASWRHPGGPATGLAGRDAFPVVAVTLEDAQAYARWKGRSLPSEVQWEWAAREARADAPRDPSQPAKANTWQGLFPVVNSADDGFVGLAPAGCYPPNALGLHDMIGNVWELTTDLYQPNHLTLEGGPGQAPEFRPGQGRQRVIKGGSFLCAPNYCMRYRAGSRQPQDEDLGASHLGFRTVLVAPGP